MGNILKIVILYALVKIFFMKTGTWIDRMTKEVESIVKQLKKHKTISYIVLIGVSVIALGSFTDGIDKLVTFYVKYFPGSSELRQTSEFIYQNNKIVGSVSGKVTIQKDGIFFEELKQTEDFDGNRPFEYMNNAYMIEKIGEVTLFRVFKSGKTEQSVLQKVTCKKL